MRSIFFEQTPVLFCLLSSYKKQCFPVRSIFFEQTPFFFCLLFPYKKKSTVSGVCRCCRSTDYRSILRAKARECFLRCRRSRRYGSSQTCRRLWGYLRFCRFCQGTYLRPFPSKDGFRCLICGRRRWCSGRSLHFLCRRARVLPPRRKVRRSYAYIFRHRTLYCFS